MRMRMALLAAVAAVLIIGPDLAGAQPASPPAPELGTPPAPPAAAPAPLEAAPPAAAMPAPEAAPPDAATRGPEAAPRSGRATRSTSRRRMCRQEARRKGLRGTEATNFAAVCLAEARLDCTKQAAAKDLAKRERNAFVRTCLGASERRRPKRPAR